MPFQEGPRLNDHESAAPIEAFRQGQQPETDWSRCPARFRFAFREQGELSEEEKVLSDERHAGKEEQPE
jgi:hypothetical protein